MNIIQDLLLAIDSKTTWGRNELKDIILNLLAKHYKESK